MLSRAGDRISYCNVRTRRMQIPGLLCSFLVQAEAETDLLDTQ